MSESGREATLKREVLVELSAAGVLAWNHPTGRARAFASCDCPIRQVISFGLEGSSDLVGILPGGRFLGVETKSPKGRLREQQGVFRARVEQLGGLYLLVRDLEDLRPVLAS